MADWIKKEQDTYICCLQETHFRPRNTYRLKVRGWKKIFHANGNQKKAGVAILISDKIDFKIKNNTNTWRLNNTLLNNQEITEEIKEEIKKYLDTSDNENTMIQNYGMQQKQF